MSQPHPFAALQAAAIDGRTHNIFHRQTQLASLFHAVQAASSSIQTAILTDQAYTPAEAALEYSTTLQHLRTTYHSLQPTEALQHEYALANHHNTPHARKPVGIVHITPTTHTFFYSVLVPLASALAAGNCIALSLPQTLHLASSTALLRSLLTSSLEQDTFALTTTQPALNQLPPPTTLCVLQTTDEDSIPAANHLLSRSSTPVVAVVDRTADLALAAHHLITARFAFAGQSPYAPDIVAVNEFVLPDFLHAVVDACVRYRKHPSQLSEKKSAPYDLQNTLDALRPTTRIIVQDPAFAVLESSSPLLPLPTTRLHSPILLVHPIRSIDDAIEQFTGKDHPVFPAAYYFSNPETGKYLAQFIPSELATVNHIPTSLFLGPVSPARFPVELSNRYPVEFFTVPAAGFINPSPENGKLSAVLQGGEKELAAVTAEAGVPLQVMKRSVGGAIGFFEQGLLLNVGIILTGTVGVVVGLGWWGVRVWRG